MKGASTSRNPSGDLEAPVNAFPRWSQLAEYVGLTVLAVLTATCTSELLPTARSAVAPQLTFTVNPGSSVAGETFIPAVGVCALMAPAFNGVVTMTIGNNPAGGTLTGAVSVRAAGCATFSNLSIDKAGSGYTLEAHSTGLSDATSAAFDIFAGLATRLMCPVGPTLLQVTAVDEFANTATGFTGSVTAVVSPGGSTAIVSAVAGVATFSNLSIPSGSTIVVTSGTMTVTCGPF